MARQSAVSAPILHHTYSCHDRHVLRRALRILKRAGSPVIPAAEEVAHAVNTREGVSGRSLQQHLRATGVLAEEGSRVEADEAAMREQVVEAEKRKLDDEEEVFWADMSGVDWRQRCLQHLAQDPLHVCKFAGRVDKCSRCVTQGRSGAACVDVGYPSTFQGGGLFANVRRFLSVVRRRLSVFFTVRTKLGTISRPLLLNRLGLRWCCWVVICNSRGCVVLVFLLMRCPKITCRWLF
ncbi:uncharacterized protein ASPGLDRAFT_988478 [Aspergillus glaucus CBS 516.65]|uniref:Uncharacterized protein n=1 Tax=Aspergillus glaucus CBS 516.65 TaxID=1160497 RepID=A0A1L9VV03_ASPGL|nr:hypothetical protein ASPGLDRAFT_988478 [Aspergillus glaucus CBS 516.65]OJJ87734.1 hypothetical protein ASPGLDRAFT_988478 [Aspergillus glaucus CBS 516.65]